MERRASFRLTVLAGALLLIAAAAWFLARNRSERSPEMVVGRATSAKIRQTGERRWVVLRNERDRYLHDPGRLNQEIHLKPTMGDGPGVVKELTIDTLTSLSRLYTAGLRQNDRIRKVNGEPVTTLSRAINLVHEIEASSRLTVEVERDGKLVDYQVDFD